MTVKEVKKNKKKLEGNIEKMINDFHEKNGVEIDSITYITEFVAQRIDGSNIKEHEVHISIEL